MNRFASFRSLASLSFVLAVAACADGDPEVEKGSTVGQQQASESEAGASDAGNAEADTRAETDASYYPCNTFTTIYRSEETAQTVADAWPGRLKCLVSIDDAGVGNGWTVSYGSDCKCPTPTVRQLPSSGKDAGG